MNRIAPGRAGAFLRQAAGLSQAAAAGLDAAAGAAAFSPPQPRIIKETIKNIPLKSVFFIDKTPQSMLVLVS